MFLLLSHLTGQSEGAHQPRKREREGEIFKIKSPFLVVPILVVPFRQ